ncbi:MAG: hypothetical protein ACJA1A_003692 [Saprospiraceae bacterium]|jgi:hypothetical protein|tara:strand:- start:1691 stop:3220 length:1530 start_codon:yes stop_codon:yes gene_type:complete
MKYLFTLLASCIFLSSFGQKDNLNPCGSPSAKSQWLLKYQKSPDSYQKRNGEVLWVPMSVTIVGTNDGLDYISLPALMEAFCTLNEDFSESEIQFFLATPVKYLKSTEYANHETVLQGAEMMFANNEPNMINTYIMENAAGNCGYNLPYAGIALSINCAQPTDHTWSHEVGHNLSLPHPFLGWEGGVSHDNSVSHDFANPAPERVTYDYSYFQDTLIVDTLIIDTAYVEKIDGSNCAFAADGFCDTKPDYLSYRWNCNSALLESNEVQTDPNGETFKSDGTLIMSYASDNCSSRFTPDQIAAMRANLIDEKPEYLGQEDVLEPTSDDEVAVITPEYLAEVYYKDVYLEWEEVENASLYMVQVTRLSSFAVPVFDTIINTHYIALPELKFKNHKHYFRVKAFNEYNFCNEYITDGAFETTDEQTNVEEKSLAVIKIRPTLLTNGVYLSIENEKGIDVEVKITNIVGKSVYHSNTNNSNQSIATDNWVPGIYLVTLRKGNSIITRKIALTK